MPSQKSYENNILKSSSSNLTSRLILLRSILRIPIALESNMASTEPSLK